MNEDLTALCDENIRSRSDFRKWARTNHPDKKGDLEQFKKISSAATNLLSTNQIQLDCSSESSKKSTPSPEVRHAPPQTESARASPAKAQCVRNVENWSKIQRHQRFDKPDFDASRMREDMTIQSPKMNSLLRTIRELDASDMASEGKRYKHFIFSDIKSGGHGAKIVASSLAAHGFSSCFDRTGKVVTPAKHPQQETFGLLSTTPVFERTFTKAMVRDVLTLYNARPANVYGENMRFVVLDSGFKEGIDLFDVKYVHIFESQRNSADFVQAVGRATRSCGQKGLDFLPNRGWPLYVYTYTLEHDDGRLVFDDYLSYAGVDLNKRVFSNHLESLAVLSAVDHDLNMEIHNYQNKTEEGALVLFGGKSNQGCDPKSKCGKRSTKDVPFTLSLMIRAYTADKPLPKAFNRMLTIDKRRFLCKKLRSDPSFCERVNAMHKRSPKDTRDDPKVPKELLDLATDVRQLTGKETRLDAPSSKTQSKSKSKTKSKRPEEMTFEEHRKHVNTVFARYAYPKLVVSNECVESAGEEKDDRIIKYTESQEFVTRYFVPDAFMKGLLVWHSVGTGKTCTAISVKSFLFERQDYWVVWVTRSTLREDIWKNMYEKICDHTLRKLAEQGKNTGQLKKAMNKRFLPPMSYRQFSNLVEGKNELSKRLIAENGKERILNNCLVIIDEAHKLYGKDLVGLEKPNMSAVERAVAASPSCKLVLMTGTPVADDPMEFVQLMNLIMPSDQAFPVDYTEFHKQYLKDNRFTEKGSNRFQEKTKGLISYLNRRFDPRRFAQPVFHTVASTLSKQSDVPLETCRMAARSQCNDEEHLLSRMQTQVEERERASATHAEKVARAEYDLSKAVPRSDESKEKRAVLKDLKTEGTAVRKEMQQARKTLRDQRKKVTQCENTTKRQLKRCEKEHAETGKLYQHTRLQECKKSK